jgi:hypothetical protein
MNQYPVMTGVIRVREVNRILINNCDFKHNDGGPMFSSVQMTNILDTSKKANTASTIFLGVKVIEATIQSSTFEANQPLFMGPYIEKHNPDLFNYFPNDYFSKSSSPIIH